MFSRTPPWSTVVCLARIVIPFSRSRSHRVHDPVDDGLVRPERAGLAEHRVDERGLAVVDVGDDGDVAEVGADRDAWRRSVRRRARSVAPGHRARPCARTDRRPGRSPKPPGGCVRIGRVTVAAVILAASPEWRLADADGMPARPPDRRRRPGRAARRRSSSSSFDPDGAVAAALAGAAGHARRAGPGRARPGGPDGPRRRRRAGRGPRH